MAKPSDHKVLFEWVNELTQLGEGGYFYIEDKSKKRQHTYRWVNQVPLNGTKDADNVNFFEYQITTEDKVTYRNSWVTDILIDESNAKELVRCARARWKIENETFNTLKNQGYHLEHNFGHGQNNLSMISFILNLLAFFMPYFAFLNLNNHSPRIAGHLSQHLTTVIGTSILFICKKSEVTKSLYVEFKSLNQKFLLA